jgi:hypothetical protein
LPSFSSILPPFFARFCSICPPFSYIFPPEIAQHPVTGELVPHLQWRLSPPRTRHVGWGVRMMCCLNVMVNGMHGNRIIDSKWSGWWFGTWILFFPIFHIIIWDNPFYWLIFFRGVEITNQIDLKWW